MCPLFSLVFLYAQGFPEAFAAVTANTECSITYVKQTLSGPVEKLFLQLNYFPQYFSSRLRSNLQLRISYLYQINSYAISLSTDQSKIYS